MQNKVYQHISEVPWAKNSPMEITLGNFDGVHLGHQYVLKQVRSQCDHSNHKMIVMTFWPHPRLILSPHTDFKLILSQQDTKYDLLFNLGADAVVEIPFTRDFSTLTPEQFLSEHILCTDNIKCIHLGYDFQFGANKQGSYHLVKNYPEILSRSIQVRHLQQYHLAQSPDKQISSSIIRKHLFNGEIEMAQKKMGRAFELSGLVIKGNGKGKKIGFPTANIQFASEQIIPSKGVYVTTTYTQDIAFRSVTNIGHNPTFNLKDKVAVETHLLNFDNDIYGERIRVVFHHKLRNEINFPTVNDLVVQISHDCQQAMDYVIDL